MCSQVLAVRLSRFTAGLCLSAVALSICPYVCAVSQSVVCPSGVGAPRQDRQMTDRRTDGRTWLQNQLWRSADWKGAPFFLSSGKRQQQQGQWKVMPQWQAMALSPSPCGRGASQIEFTTQRLFTFLNR